MASTNDMLLESTSSEREILPEHLRPIHYDLLIESYLEEAVEFDGTVVIELGVVEETTSITLNTADLEISKTEVFAEDGRSIETTKLEFDTARERVTIGLKELAKAGQNIKLKQSFKGSLLHGQSGFFRSPVVIDGKTTWMASTQLEATDARRVFPSFDEPALKATFSVTLIAESHFTCLSNMEVASETLIGDGKKEVAFNKTPLMSTYILAFTIGEFQMIETNSFRVPVRVYTTMDKNIEHGRHNLEHTARALKVFEKIFDIEYPLPKLDMIAISGHQGAMENWGLIIFSDTYLLMDEKESSAEAFRLTGSCVVHEVAHQWFGNLVTMEFWDGLWLNEAFADWAELHAWETLDPSWQMWLNYTAGGYQKALLLDANPASHPIEVPVNKATEIAQIFDDISYDKGCAVIRMISTYLGVELFIKGVRKYLKKAAYGNASTNDLWDALSEVSGKDVVKIMGTWTKHIGYPLVHVIEDPSTQTITITQHRFLQDGSLNPSDDTIIYPLKLRLLTSSGIDTELELLTRSITIPMPSTSFFKINAHHFGFYRTLYTPHRLSILSQNAKDNLLSPEDKIGLISDVLATAGSGFSKTSSVLTLLSSFSSETNFFVWKQALFSLEIILGAWAFEDEDVRVALQDFRVNLLSKILLEKGWGFDDSDNNVEQMFKALIFSNSGDSPRIKEGAKEMFGDFLEGDEKPININIREAVFVIALRNGGVEEYEAILTSFSKTSNVDNRNIILNSLGHTTHPELLTRTLSLALSPSILAINETERILESLSKHAAGKEALWRWFKDNFEKISEMVHGGLGRFAKVVGLCLEGLSTREQLRDVRSFFEGRDTEDYNIYLAQAMGSIEAKAKWAERDREDVRDWLLVKGYLKTK